MTEDELATERLKAKTPSSKILREWAAKSMVRMNERWDKQKEEFDSIERPDPANCISCGKEIVKDEHDLLQDAVSLSGTAHYGSGHDLSMIEVVVCDECIIKKKVICVPLFGDGVDNISEGLILKPEKINHEFKSTGKAKAT